MPKNLPKPGRSKVLLAKDDVDVALPPPSAVEGVKQTIRRGKQVVAKIKKEAAKRPKIRSIQDIRDAAKRLK